MIRDRAPRIARKVRKYPGIRPATHCPKSACKSQYFPDVYCPVKTCRSRYRRIARLPDYPKRACQSRYFQIQHQQYQGLTKSTICKKRRVTRKYYGKERWRITRYAPALPDSETWGLGTASPHTSRKYGVVVKRPSSQQQSFSSQIHDGPFFRETVVIACGRSGAQETPDNFLNRLPRYTSSFACLHTAMPATTCPDCEKRLSCEPTRTGPPRARGCDPSHSGRTFNSRVNEKLMPTLLPAARGASLPFTKLAGRGKKRGIELWSSTKTT
jgi:hypothetical protein